MISLIVGSILITIGTFIGSFSWVRLFTNLKNLSNGIKQCASPVPLVGSLLFFAGYGMLPIEHSWWALLFLLLDFDTLITFIVFPIMLIKEVLSSLKDEDTT